MRGFGATRACAHTRGAGSAADPAGSGRPGKTDFVAKPSCRAVEDFVRQVEGFQMLYADSYLTRDEFRDMFDHEHYDLMKARYDAHGAFPEVYEKTCKKALKLWGATGGEDSEEKKRQ